MRRALMVVVLLLSGCTAATETDPADDVDAAEGFDEAEDRDQGEDPGKAPASAGGTNGSAPEPPTPFEPGWPLLSEARIRPGVRLEASPASPVGVPTGIQCTANFIYASPDNHSLYIGAASHCMAGRKVNTTIAVAGIPEAGAIVYCSYVHVLGREDCGQAPSIADPNDFALIRIRDEHRGLVHPALIHWGGPKAAPSDPSAGDAVLAYTNSSLNPSHLLARSRGTVVDTSPQTTYVRTIGSTGPGNSGGPLILASGEAVGHMMGISTDQASYTASNHVPMLAYMHEVAGIEVELKTWRLLEP